MSSSSTSTRRRATSRPAEGRPSSSPRPTTTARSASPSSVPSPARRRGYPWEVEIPENESVSGVVLSDQVKSLDWRKRHAAFICTPGVGLLEEVVEKALALLSPEEED